MIARRRPPIGVLLAGGDGRRMGGDKACVDLAGRPLAHWVLDALCGALADVVVACRLDTKLPALPGVREAWVEPDGPRGALVGIMSALREARGRSVVVCGVSLPLMTSEVIESLATVDASGRPAVVPRVGGRLEPLVARYEPAALRVLAGLRPDTPLGAAVASLEPAPVLYVAEDPAFMQVDAPEDLLRAAAVVDGRAMGQRSRR